MGDGEYADHLSTRDSGAVRGDFIFDIDSFAVSRWPAGGASWLHPPVLLWSALRYRHSSGSTECRYLGSFANTAISTSGFERWRYPNSTPVVVPCPYFVAWFGNDI